MNVGTKLGRKPLLWIATASVLIGFSVRAEDASPAQRGKETFALYCASCHGEGASGGFGPALTNLAGRKDKREVEAIIRQPASPMPPLYPATINDGDVTDIVAYLQSLQGH